MNDNLELLLYASKGGLYEAMRVKIEYGGTDGFNQRYFVDYHLIDKHTGEASFYYRPDDALIWNRFYPLDAAKKLMNPKAKESQLAQAKPLYLGSIAHVKTLLELERLLPNKNIIVEHQDNLTELRLEQLKKMNLPLKGLSFAEYVARSKSYLQQKGFHIK